MVHFSPTRLPPGEMERRDPVRAEVPPALPVLVPGLAHFLVVGLKVKSKSEVTQSCLTLPDLMD